MMLPVLSLLVRVRRAAAIGLVLVATSAGCGAPTGAGPADGPAAPGGEYVVTSVTEGGRTRPVVEGSEIRLTFRDGDLAIHAGCNHLGGSYEIDGDTITAGAIGGTEMGCPEALMAQDAWLAAFFGGEVVVGQDPLRLTAGDIVLTLAPRGEAHPDRALLSTSWILDGLIAGESVSSVPAGPEVVLTFAAPGAVGVTGLCNGFGAEVAVTDDTITWEAGMRTLMACADEARNQLDTQVAAVLTGRTSYTIEEDTLTVRKGDHGLSFRAR